MTTLRVLIVRVTSIDEGVSLLHEGLEPCDCLIHRIAGGNHDPDCAWCSEVLHQIDERVDSERSGCRQLRGRVFIEVEANDLVTGKTQTLRHVEAHLAESDDSQFHPVFPSLCGVCAGLSQPVAELV